MWSNHTSCLIFIEFVPLSINTKSCQLKKLLSYPDHPENLNEEGRPQSWNQHWAETKSEHPANSCKHINVETLNKITNNY